MSYHWSSRIKYTHLQLEGLSVEGHRPLSSRLRVGPGMVSDTLLINMYKGQLESKVMTTHHSKMKVIPHVVM